MSTLGAMFNRGGDAQERKGFMSDKVKRNLEQAILWFAVTAATWNLVTNLVMIPKRIEAVETEQRAQKVLINDQATSSKVDHELLVRIEERLITVQRELERRK